MSSVAIHQCPRWDGARRPLWLLAAVFVVFLIYWEGRGLVQVLCPPSATPRDFFQEWASARNVWNDLPVYSSQEETIPLYLGTAAEHGSHFVAINAHPPVSVLLGLPLSVFNYRAAHLTWNLLSLLALVGSVAIIARTLRVAGWMQCAILVAYLVLSGPLRVQLFHGQLNLVLLLLVTGVWWADRSGHAKWAGALLGLATAIKFLPGLLFLYFALRRQWSALGAGIVSLLASFAVGLAVLGPGAFQDYAESALPQVGEFRSDWLNCSIPGLCHKLFNPGTKGSRVEPIVHAPIVAYSLIALGSTVILGALAAAIVRARSRSQCDAVFGLTLVAMLLVSPIAWDHYFLLLLLPLAFLWQRLPRNGLYLGMLLVVVAVMWLPPWRIYRMWGWCLGAAPTRVAGPWETLTVLSLQFYALLGLFGLNYYLAMRRPSLDADMEHGGNSSALQVALPALG